MERSLVLVAGRSSSGTTIAPLGSLVRSVVIVTLLVSGAAAQTIHFVQVNSSAPTSASTLNSTFSSAQTAGNLNIVAIGWSDTTNNLTSVSDSKGNTYKLAVTYASSSLGMTQAIYYASGIAAASAGANTVTVKLSGSTSYPDLRVAEYAGVSAPDKTASAGGTSTTASSGAVTTTSANELLFGTNYTFGSTNGPGSGYTSRTITNNGDIVEDRVVSATGAYSATASVTSANWIMQLVTFSGGPQAISVSVSPVTATVNAGSTQSFTATVNNDAANKGVTWSVSCASSPCGSVSPTSTASGVATAYTAPSTPPASTLTVTLKATSVSDTTKSASATISLPAVSVSVSPPSATVAVNQTQQFTAAVTGSSNTAVTWQVNGVTGGNSTEGIISSAGLYTAPSSVPSPATGTVSAVSQADASKSGSASVTITSASGSTFYVSTTGSNSNNGSLLSPWQTITYAISQVSPGSTIAVRRGVYNERILINKSLTLQSYPGETATVDGTGITIGSTGYAYGLVDIAGGLSNVTVSGLEIRNFITTTTSLVPAGIHMEGTGSNIQILNNHIHDIQNKGSYSGPKNGSCTGTIPNAFGLVFAGTNGTTPISNYTISGNELNNLITGCSESMTVNGDTQNFTISNNVIHDNSNIGIAALGGEGVAPAHDYASNGTISVNTIYNIHSSSQAGKPWDVYGTACVCADGIYLDGSDSIIEERNLVHDVDWGTETTGEKAGQNTTNITVRDNVFYSNSAAGMGIGGQGNGGGAANITVVNNTFYNNDTAGQGNGTLSLGNAITGYVRFKNNIVDTSSGGHTITGKTGTSGLDFDYNLYYGGSSPFSEAHSLNTNPQFVNSSAMPPNLDIQSGSPANEAGINLGSSLVGTLDYPGNPRVQGNIDIGAYEH